MMKELKYFAPKMPKEDVFLFSWRDGLMQNNFVNLTPIYMFQLLQAYSCQWKTQLFAKFTWLYLHIHSGGTFASGSPSQASVIQKILAMTEETMILKFTTKTHGLC